MLSFKGILKYGIYLFIAGWMFVLGIMVGRGNSPVSFDTQRFQKRLERIANQFGQKDETKKEIDLEFYKVLDQPAPREKVMPKVAVKSKKSPPAKMLTSDPADVKKSTKKRTIRKDKTRSIPEKRAVAPKIEKKAETSKQDYYTIQVAAYKDNKDAIARVAALKKKGVAAYRQKGVKDGMTWYRVRAGSFGSIEEAKKFKEQLAEKKIKAMIIKKDSHENIER